MPTATKDQTPVALIVPEADGFHHQPGVPMTMSRQTQGTNLPIGSNIENRLANLYGFEILQVFKGVEMLGWEKINKYNIHETLHPTVGRNQNPISVGPHILFAREVGTDCCERQCCGPNRAANIQFHAGTNKESPAIATFAKNFHCQGCCCMRASAKMLDSRGAEIADLYDPFYLCDFNVRVKDAQGNLIYFITGPCCQLATCFPCMDFSFEIREAGTKKVVGNVVKVFNGCEELCTDTNRFRVTFPQEIPVAHKLALLGALFLLDFEYFEKKK